MASIKLLGAVAEIQNGELDAYVKIGGFKGEYSFNPTAERDDRTVADDTHRNSASTIIDGGNLSLTVRYSFTDVGQVELNEMKSGTVPVRNLRITHADGNILIIPVYVKSLPAEWADEGTHGVGQYNLKVAGKYTVTPA